VIGRLCIIGVGLIGGSLARALRVAGAVGSVVGAGRRREPLETARRLGVIDDFDQDLARAVAGADVVVVAVPLLAMESVFRTIAAGLAPGAIVTDVGSAKLSVVEAARLVFGGGPARFVPGHPIAGTEKSGVEASFPTLFHRRRVILTPHAGTDADALARVRAMWEVAGAEVVLMDPGHHDEVLAATSHLPHLLAYTLVDALARMEERTEIFRFAAGGFRDFTRIASSDPTMWHDVCLANRDAILTMLMHFRDDLDRLTAAVRHQDGEYIRAVFSRAKAARDRFAGIEEAGGPVPARVGQGETGLAGPPPQTTGGPSR
jgi:prephenate dehydrogenase